MGFIERELDRLEGELRGTDDRERQGLLYAAQQALKWATEPQGFAAPLDVILRGAAGLQPATTDTLAETAGCLAAPRPPRS